ncbi:hypothetical protein LQU94_02035 [Peptoniphilus sp. KCTC 25270]|uniref:hypothetical protein n=1 Tax=Peptoniphilus sp. KCTC 25270 TaxID=2897414 RepID=UPI001E550823|nr:hypothetical protein [Peptoniphilus sp. KCTC 25270]MCD1146893.1 hypothetical protein [Peptoniphilus sp. KCTC 25270]
MEELKYINNYGYEFEDEKQMIYDDMLLTAERLVELENKIDEFILFSCSPYSELKYLKVKNIIHEILEEVDADIRQEDKKVVYYENMDL